MTDHRLPHAGPALVSLIMPVWRPRQDWMLEAVRSALAQRGCSIELVIVADGGDEPLEEWLAPVADERVRVVRMEHGGLSRARNTGVAAARGALIRFIDGDDVLPPDSTAQLMALTDAATVIGYGATLVCDVALRPLRVKGSSLQGNALEACLCSQFAVTLPAMLLPRRIIELTGDSDPTRINCEDWDFVLRALEHATVRGTSTVVYHYRRHGGSATARLDVAEAERAVAGLYDGYFARHPDQIGTRLQRRAQAGFLLDWAVAYANARRFREAAHRLANAAMLDPLGAARVLAAQVGHRVRARLRQLARTGRPA